MTGPPPPRPSGTPTGSTSLPSGTNAPPPSAVPSAQLPLPTSSDLGTVGSPAKKRKSSVSGAMPILAPSEPVARDAGDRTDEGESEELSRRAPRTQANGTTSSSSSTIPPAQLPTAEPKNAALSTRLSPPPLAPLSLPTFPVLPPSIPSPSQTFQTPSQVSSILSLPPNLLLQLARTDSPLEQQAIAEKKGVKGYLSSMAIPPPSPTTLVTTLVKEGGGGGLIGLPVVNEASEKEELAAVPTGSAGGLPARTSTPSPLPAYSLPPDLSLTSSSATTSSALVTTSTSPSPSSPTGAGHPAIPVLLGQIFAPPPLTPGVLAPIPGTSGIGEILRGHGPASVREFASVEDWSYRTAKDQVFSSLSTSASTAAAARPALATSPSFTEREISSLASQIKDWALSEQEKLISHQVVESKSAAVVLAAAHATSSVAEKEQGGEDLSAYAEVYKKQLDALASGYFAQLHRDALKRLTEEKVGSQGVGSRRGSETDQAVEAPLPSTSGGGPDSSLSSVPVLSSSQAPTLTSLTSLTSSRSQAEAMHVRASAAAAVAAQVMAATSLARQAGEKLADLGVDPRKVVEEVEELVGSREGRRGSAGMEELGKILERAGSRRGSRQEERDEKGKGKEEVVVVPARRASEAGRSDAMSIEEVGQQPAAAATSGDAVASTSSSAQVADARPASAADLASLPTAQRPSRTSPSSSRSASVAQAAPPAPVFVAPQQPADLAALASPAKRDYLLAYAHQLYSTNPASEELLPLLHTLENVHPDHLPTLLLISCVYYTRGELESSLYYNKRLLEHDPSYVEAMSNIGTTLRAMGKWNEAEAWWWKAIKLRPTYWDATENLLGVLCNPATAASPEALAAAGVAPPPIEPRYQEALALCDYVESQIFAHAASLAHPAVPPTAAYFDPVPYLPRPRTLPSVIPQNHVHRLQNLLYAKGNLRLTTQDPALAQDEYEKAIELALSLPEWARRLPSLLWPVEGCTTRDLVVAATVVGKILAAFAEAGSNPASAQKVSQMAQQLGVADERGSVPFERLLRTIKDGGDAYVQRLLAMGGGVVPTVLLEPQMLVQLPTMLFSEMRGTLPSMLDPAIVSGEAHEARDPTRQQTVQSTNQTTSTMLLTLAKGLQDSLGPTSASRSTIGGIPASQSLLLPLYYVALALYPSPSTCNNLGILLSTLNATTIVAGADPSKPPVVVTGQMLALRYYEAGLKLDPKHPHLYTNYGSLLKDLGKLPEAVAMYKRAVEFNPNFDVALANLANAVKDTGQIQESIPYYRRAVELNPSFPEAICGLVNALGGVCDWQNRGGVDEEWIVDDKLQLHHVKKPTNGRRIQEGYHGAIADLVRKQLHDGYSYGVGSLAACGTIQQWLSVISQALYGVEPAQVGDLMKPWAARLTSLSGKHDRAASLVNEGGYLIRLVERLMRRIQRRWYLATFGPQVYANPAAPAPQPIFPKTSDIAHYRRPMLPPSLPAIPVPTVLPFHCFTLPVTARETRLISHRTGLRISHATLNQPWMPPIVYPPPRPPVDGKINVGYVSSDLGNHPLSHLMQSVFGLHDLSRFNVFVYATSPSDKSPYRQKIEAESQHFLDVSHLGTQQIVERIVHDQIHILINLSGYTKGARNEVFAARPSPVQMSYMGFASTLSAGWCDYFIVDPIVCPPHLISGNQWRYNNGYTLGRLPNAQPSPRSTDFEGDIDPESDSNRFVYTEKLIYLPHSYFVTDHKQAWREEETAAPVTTSLARSEETTWALEEAKRLQMRRQMFPNLRDDTVIFANWNQLYKIDPFIFRIWLEILKKHPNSVLWLLRFPAPGEAHLKETALRWAGKEVADRVIFTDVANKNDHIHRGRIADLFLDTTECNAHTTAADILWSGTPILTFPRHAHKMCSRVAASIAMATGFGPQMIVNNEHEYERRALELAAGLVYDTIPADPSKPPTTLEGREQRRSKGELAELRKKLFLTREQSPLFDTKRWVRNLEKGLVEAWTRWVQGTEFEDAPEWTAGPGRASAAIFIPDDVDGANLESRKPYF
ncbi:hypothetical protein NBRC10512_003260 [Rhodotorula toruloides]|uniref:protein O-GlcNAc transferase n=2 Tax=Rhodotorula toruloides TaxID=5286 RepID=A0A061BQA0_RHOTO|nr:polypeptide N-acetylglucosaminyltransferase, glycosyltransferase family 41 protein [Rhodotorula toruloides NP11]EMS19301.1 polypeptide N-acetylglucosaminyltransferase, glycosyltransferase family 41 protein [Rhodotorula toruloides NP11]CDR49250.1 RHTO0S24e01794g1_1 [Rhodotorula toruloides]